tara:strand:- start:7178 stop:10708 length:3531 start_codon:yes stop_codon:yes gene_type:complete
MQQILNSKKILNKKKITLNNIQGSSTSLILSEIYKDIEENNKQIIIISPDYQKLTDINYELRFFYPECAEDIHFFPDWEILPYDLFSPNIDIVSERLKTLYNLSSGKKGIYLITLHSAQHKICPKEYIKSNIFFIENNTNVNRAKLIQDLTNYGYINSPLVKNHGEIAVRGSILDIFPMGSKTPYRIDFFDNDVESIRIFDPETQQSISKIDKISLMPTTEFPFTEQSIKIFKNNWREHFTGNPLKSPIYQNISNQEPAAGIEYYIPLFFNNELNSVFDYINDNGIIFTIGNINDASIKFLKDVKERFNNLNIDHTKPILDPKYLFLSQEELFNNINKFKSVKFKDDVKQENINNNLNEKSIVNLDIERLPDISIASDSKSLQNPLNNFKNFIALKPDLKILICAETDGRLETLLELFKKNNINLNILNQTKTQNNIWNSFLKLPSSNIYICTAALNIGFIINKINLAVIAETDLYTNKILQRRFRKKRFTSKFKDIELNAIELIQSLSELTIGDPIVHQNHGIGRYQGLSNLKVNNIDTEFLTVLYANNSKLYVPITSLDLISKYTTSNPDLAPLHNLGNQKWSKDKTKASQKIIDMAAKLLDLYAKRLSKKGYKFKIPNLEYHSFADTFPFEETLDQEKAISEVLNDMQQEKPMDRLVCGDVGFGKTEVAIRAAFIAAHNSKQIAILVPTTLLAEQHYEVFKNRFANMAINIDILSRFKTKKEQLLSIEKLKAGNTDIIIGTHKIIQNDIKFKNLGLLIIDEEHRFGVKQKEKIKALAYNVDILTLTATPIPRTLNMALAGIRDLSIIATPPSKRLAIKTFIHERNYSLIQEALNRELLRGGQVYFLHNDIKSMNKVAEEVEKLVPDAKIVIAHGQMKEVELEKIMTDFYHKRANVLICTTIIETGIDIPNANTIIIDRADKLGLAQLHQIRGRVGRSHHQAYAYMFTPPFKALSKDAQKRIEALEQLKDLGAGFNLATYDMDIRGSGEILGDEQSGNIESIGYSLYMDMLNRAVEDLKSGTEIEKIDLNNNEIEINLGMATLIPESYLPDVNQRLNFYKKIASSKNDQEFNNIKFEMQDRFGSIPPQIENLFIATKIKTLCKKYNINKINVKNNESSIKFTENNKIDLNKLLKLLQTKPHKYKLINNDQLKAKFDSDLSLYDNINNLISEITS